jgi:septal ring factor EnvC (AmiA/AmiB activator)
MRTTIWVSMALLVVAALACGCRARIHKAQVPAPAEQIGKDQPTAKTKQKKGRGKAQPAAKDAVAVNAQIDRLEYEVAALDKDIKRQTRTLAEMSIDITQLKSDLAQSSQQLERSKSKLQTCVELLDKGMEPFTIDGQTYNKDQLKRKVGETFRSCRLLEQKLDAQKQLLTVKQKRYNTLHEQVNRLADQRRQFQVQLTDLRVNEEKLNAKNSGTSPDEPGSRVDRIKKGILELQKQQERLKIEGNLLQQPPFVTEPDVVGQPPASVELNLDEVRNYLKTQHKK